jgi:hypothetical protein
MSSRKKPQSTRKTDVPEWAADVKPSNDVMAMFYAPTGQPKQGPLIPVAPTSAAPEPKEEEGTVDEQDDDAASEPIPSAAQAEDVIKTISTRDTDELEISDNSSLVDSQADPEHLTSDHHEPDLKHNPANLPVAHEMVMSGVKPKPEIEPLFPNLVGDEARLTKRSEVGPTNKSAKRQSPRGADFERYFGEWKPFLTYGQISVLEALFDMTHAQEQAECFTSNAKIARAAGISARQTSAILKDLEHFGFIARLETFNTRTKKGTVFHLYLTRQPTPASVKRVYHLEDE